MATLRLGWGDNAPKTKGMRHKTVSFTEMGCFKPLPVLLIPLLHAPVQNLLLCMSGILFMEAGYPVPERQLLELCLQAYRDSRVWEGTSGRLA